MKYNETNAPLICMMTQSTCYRSTRIMDVKGVLWHSTGADNPTLKRYVQPDDDAGDRAQLLAKLGKNEYGNDWNHSDREAGVNAFIGKLADGSVTAVQVMPWDYRPWGCGSGSKGSCNNGWIQFEICEDGLTDAGYFGKIYDEACEITAYLCKLYNIDPAGTVTADGVRIPTILCHQDSYRLGFGSDHDDVLHWFTRFGKTMDDVRSDVAALLRESEAPASGSFKPGDLVRITGTKYYSGGTIPGWVKEQNWFVKSVNGDRVVIDRNEDGTNSISSPMHASDLAPVTEDPVYVVQKGDTLSSVAKKYGTTYQKLAEYNGISNPDLITVGQKIRIPGA